MDEESRQELELPMPNVHDEDLKSAQLLYCINYISSDQKGFPTQIIKTKLQIFRDLSVLIFFSPFSVHTKSQNALHNAHFPSTRS